MIHARELPAVPIRAGERTTYRIRPEVLKRWVLNKEGRGARQAPRKRGPRSDTKPNAVLDENLTRSNGGAQAPVITSRTLDAHASVRENEGVD